MTKQLKRQELVTTGEITAGDWRFLFGYHGNDCHVYFKGKEIRGIESVIITAKGGHVVTANIQFLTSKVEELELL